jgi:phospholipid/cholesterol/gamma-HCH transport system substrate-binding protein
VSGGAGRLASNRLARAGVALAVIVAAVVVTVVSVRAANGDYSGDYRLTGYFPRAGEGLAPGSEVVYRGVQVGRVSAISLAGHRARVTLLLQSGFRVPADTTATIEPLNLFGAEQVTLRVPGSGPTAGPFLAPGAVLARTVTSDELGALFTAAAPLLNRITRQNLATVVGALGAASNGEGPRIKASIGAGANLAAFFDRTLDAQLAAFDSFSNFTAALAPDGTSLNGIARAENVALPAFNQEAADYQKLLTNLTGFSAELARLLTDYHPTIDTLLSDGANPARVLTAQQTELGQIISGAYHYANKVGTAISRETLPTGSHFVYFTTFVLFTQVNQLVCDLIAPPVKGLAYFEPLQQVLAGAGTPFTCKGQIATFDAMQAKSGPATVAPPPTATSLPTTKTPAVTTATKALNGLGTTVYNMLGQPQQTNGTSIGSYIGSILGGTP